MQFYHLILHRYEMGDQHLYMAQIISFQFNPSDISIGQYDLDILLFPKEMSGAKYQVTNGSLQENYIEKKN